MMIFLMTNRFHCSFCDFKFAGDSCFCVLREKYGSF